MVKRLLFSFFLHRLSGGPEPRRRFTLTGGAFFADIQRKNCALRSAGDCRIRGGDKEEGTPAVCP